MSWIYTLIFSSLIAGVSGDAPKVDLTTINPSVIQAEVVLSETKRIEKTFPLSANGRLSVSNVNGSIDIKSWDRAEVQVVATITADTTERLDDVEVVFDAKPDSITIETDYGRWNRSSGGQWKQGTSVSVGYVIMAPRGAILNDIETVNGSVTLTDFTNVVKSSAVNGSVRATNIRGTASLETVNGEVYAEFDRLESTNRISLGTVNGRVNLVLPSDANATLKADSLNGNITNDFGLPVRKGKYVGRDMYGKIGRGDVHIKLESVNGTLNVTRKNDGRQQSPAVDLLPTKGKDDDEDFDVDIEDFDAAAKSASKASRELAKADRAAARASAQVAARMAEAAPELARLGIEAAKLEAQKAKLAENAIDMKGLEKMKVDMEKIAVTMPEMAVYNYAPSMPRVVKQSNTFSVKNKPDVIVNGDSVDVRIIGWDEPTVKYTLVEVASSRTRNNITVKENNSDSKVELTVEGAAGNRPAGMRIGPKLVVYVPKRSDLKVSTEGEIRVEGVSGKLEVEGGEQSVNLRDIKGELTVSSTEGLIRVVGFDGKLNASSDCGVMSLEGSFATLNARSDTGEIVVTVPAASNALINAMAKNVRSEGVELKRGDGEDSYQLGRGGSIFTIETSKDVVVRSTESITTIQ
ncbi:MAG TPA: DUF4097 family beta strand repeat-containing protein [Pyrinomonadaceae bacterium]|nr:DUF4097 family beta strand repeat-containing protein [Pyrinomonadaceae bacterium]